MAGERNTKSTQHDTGQPSNIHSTMDSIDWSKQINTLANDVLWHDTKNILN